MITKSASFFSSMKQGIGNRINPILQSTIPKDGLPLIDEVKRDSVKSMLGKAPGLSLIAAIATTTAISKAIRAIMNNTRKKALIEDLMISDPVIKNADKEQVLEYYALIDHIAPAISLEKPIVRELLQTFVRFGRVDMNSLKLLTETQKNYATAKKEDGSLSDVMGPAVAVGSMFM